MNREHSHGVNVISPQRLFSIVHISALKELNKCSGLPDRTGYILTRLFYPRTKTLAFLLCIIFKRISSAATEDTVLSMNVK